MLTIDATEAANDIEKVWKKAANGPITITSDGQAIAVVLSPANFAELAARRQGAKAGFAKDLFKGMDMNALLETSVEDVFEGYL